MRPVPAIRIWNGARTGLISLWVATAWMGCQREFSNPSDPNSDRFTEKSQAILQRLGTFDLVDGDTIRVYAGVGSRPVLDDGLVIRYAWDLDGDGKTDSVLERDDTLEIILNTSGMRHIKVALTDKAGFQDSAELRMWVRPDFTYQMSLPKYDTGCPAYAQEPLLMRLPLALTHFTVEKTWVEGLESAEFAIKLAQTLSGIANPIGILDGFDYGFSKGLYRFNQNGLQFEVAFHYGPGVTGHSEGDTVMENLFDLDSYVRIRSIQLVPPSVDFSPGPLSDLVDADISVDLNDIRNPRFDFKIDFNRIRVSLKRKTQSLLVLSNQSLTVMNALFFTLYQGHAHLKPAYPSTLLDQFSKDSLTLDLAGSKVFSPDLPIQWSYATEAGSDSGIYTVSLTQVYKEHAFHTGNASGKNKVFGAYTAVNTLASRDFSEDIHFQGRYSSAIPDSATFFCREPVGSSTEFGLAAFETEVANEASFESRRYGYEFKFPFSVAEPWKGPSDALPLLLRENGFPAEPWVVDEEL